MSTTQTPAAEPTWQRPEPEQGQPSLLPTIIVSTLAPPFGFIPADRHALQAAGRGLPRERYWIAWAFFGFFVAPLFWLLFWTTVVAGGLATSDTDSTSSKPDGPSQATASIPATEESQPEVPPAPNLTAADFKLDVKVLTRECFGDAGCSLTVRVQPTLIGAKALDGSQSVLVQYTLTGGEDGPITETFTASGDGSGGMTAEITDQVVSTKSKSTKITAKVLDVLAE
jgi:hypothetical protein